MLGSSVWRLFPLSLVSCQPHTAGVCYPLQRQVQTISHMSPNSETSVFPVRACKAKSLQSRPTLCNPLDPPGSSVFGILQARILEWVAIPFPRESFQPRDQNQVSCIAGRFSTNWAMREAHKNVISHKGAVLLRLGSRIRILIGPGMRRHLR